MSLLAGNIILLSIVCDFVILLLSDKSQSMGNVILASARSRLSSAQVCDTRQQPIVSQVCTQCVQVYSHCLARCVQCTVQVYRTFATIGRRQAVRPTLTSISCDARDLNCPPMSPGLDKFLTPKRVIHKSQSSGFIYKLLSHLATTKIT